MSLLQLASMAELNSSSAQPLAKLPANLLETFIPGYGTISRLMLDTFGIDITLIVSLSFFAFALFRSVDYLKNQLLAAVMRFGTCSVEISADGDTYHWVMDWLADRGIGQDSHHLIAVGSHQTPPMNRGMVRPRIASRKTRKTQRYEPCLGQTQYFWNQGRLFRWHRHDNRQFSESRIEGRLYCLSRTTAPIKNLIDEASLVYHQKRSHNTAIRRPAPRQQRHHGVNLWRIVAMRPSRPLDTVVLEEEQKDQLLSDIEEYLRPSTREWYAVRGIPYRRGYLFEGPPGTGKTSLSFAIAGFFDLDVFCVSLAEPSITEEDLVSLFDELPEQCLVLLEDVDSAGLVVRDIQPHSTSALQRPPGGNPYEMTSRPHGTGITLSGLLNVIDGIASQEGRVLIMTTNHVNSLDAALLRPGRVDLRIHFDLASKKQAEDLFLQTFAERSHEELDSAKNTEQKDDLEEMARTFSAGIPERMLSPAGIQGYLMNWKKKPAEAVANIKEWVAESTKKDDKPPTKLVNGDHDPSRK